MLKQLLRAVVYLHAGLVLAVAASLLCSPPPAHARPSSRVTGIFAALGSGKKKEAPPERPPIRSTQPPALTIPVEQLGFSAPGEFYLGSRNSLVSLDFLDENRLLFTFRVPGLIHRDHNSIGNSDERQIRAVVLHLPDGNVQAETLWTLHDRSRYLYMLKKGQFLLRDGNDLRVGDASLQLKPFLHFPGPILWVEMDPSQQFLVAGSSEPKSENPKAGDVPRPATASATVQGDEDSAPDEPGIVLRILRRDNASVMLVSRVRTAIHLPINNDGYLEALRSKGMTWVLNLNHFTGGSTIVGSVDSLCTPIFNFISVKEFLVTACNTSGDPRLVAMTTQGRRLWENPGLGQSVWPVLEASEDGSRIAWETLVTDHEVNSFAPLGSDDIKSQDVSVMDAATGKLAMRAQASPIFDVGGNVAISPNGKQVAIVIAGAIQIFNLPPPPPLQDTPPPH